MSIKLTRKQLKQIILEELEEIRTDGRGFGPAQVATAKALSAKGVANRPESVRKRLMQCVADLDLQNPTQDEIRQLADMVTSLMDAAQDADEVGLEEDLLSLGYEEMENYLQLYQWITALGFPESIGQFAELKSQGNLLPEKSDNDDFHERSDATLMILNSNFIKFDDKNTVLHVKYNFRQNLVENVETLITEILNFQSR